MNLVRTCILEAFELFGLNRIFRWASRSKLLVVCYHGVARPERTNGAWLQLPTTMFEKQLEYLSANYHILPIDEAITLLRANKLERPTASITFDDGYLNNYTEALPILQRFGVPATVYLATGLIGTDGLLWTTRLTLALEASVGCCLDLTELSLGQHQIDSLSQATRLAECCTLRLKEVPPARRDHVLSIIIAQLPLCELPLAAEHSMMGCATFRLWQKPGWFLLARTRSTMKS